MDLSILKYCPHCDAPMTPTSYNFCIGESEKCSCCDNKLPKDHNFKDLSCSVCTKTLRPEDFTNKKATYTHDQIICLDCLKAKRLLQKEKEIYNCDFCGEELTQLDFLEDNAEIKRMLIVCSSCKVKHFKEDEHKPEARKKEKKSNGVSETKQTLLEAVKSTVEELDKKTDEPDKPNRIEIVTEEHKETEEKTSNRQPVLQAKSLLNRHEREKTSLPGYDQRAALGCLVALVILLSAGIAYLLYNQYSKNENDVTENLTYLIESVKDRQETLADKLENFGNRLYALEQLEMMKQNTPDAKTTDDTEKPTEHPEKAPDKKNENEAEDKDETVKISPKMREILGNLESDKAADQLNAIMDISWENYRAATPKLIEILKNETDKYLRVFAIITLVSFREKDVIPVLKDIVFKEKKSIVTETAEQAIVELEKFAR